VILSAGPSIVAIGSLSLANCKLHGSIQCKLQYRRLCAQLSTDNLTCYNRAHLLLEPGIFMPTKSHPTELPPPRTEHDKDLNSRYLHGAFNILNLKVE
jgi:hypothetical protein